MKKEHFKKDHVMHDPKKMKNEKNTNTSQRADDSSDEEDEFDETLRKGSRSQVNPNLRDQSRED